LAFYRIGGHAGGVSLAVTSCLKNIMAKKGVVGSALSAMLARVASSRSPSIGIHTIKILKKHAWL